MTRSPGLCLMLAALASGGCPKAPQKGGPGLPQPMIAAMPDLVGFASTVDGSGSTDPSGRSLTYLWHLSSVPQGSALTDAAFADPSAAMTTFEPDVGGAYGVTLAVSTADGSVNQLTKSVVVPTAPIFYATGDGDANSTSFGASVIRSDGTGARPLSCPSRVDLGADSMSTGDFTPGQQAFIAGVASLRAFDGAVPQVAFVHDALSATGTGWNQQLFAANDQSDCAGHAALRVDVAAQLGAGDWSFFFPRFSPDGKRIAFLALGQTSMSTLLKVVTVGSDGSGFRAVRNFPQSNDRIVAPAWVDANTVAWIEYVGTMSPLEFKIVKSADAANAGDGSGASTVVDCAAGTPFVALSQFEFADSSTLIFAAATVGSMNNTPGLVNLYRESAGSCTATNHLTNETTIGHFSGDFSLSPDKKTVLFTSTSGSPPPATQDATLTDIFVVPVDGSAAAKRIAGDSKFVDAAPRFVSNGRQIVWTQFGKLPTATGNGPALPSVSSLMMANSDGTHVRTLVAGSNKPGEVHYVLSGNSLGNACAIGGASASAGALSLLAVALVGAFARRRRRLSA
jgi:MYXO-CTERM domain-containing protein